jgi:hypothetical protein
MSNAVCHIYKYYPLLLQENLYTLSSAKTCKQPYQVSQKFYFNFIKIKRALHSIRYQTYFENKEKDFITSLSKNNKIELKYLSLKPTLVILNNIFSEVHKKNKYRSFVQKNHTYNSIQIGLMNMEYRWSSYHGCMLENYVYSCIHPEIIVRILRKQIYDTSFLHFLRYILHYSISYFSSNKYKLFSSDTEKLITFLFNLYLKEFDKFFSLNYSNSFNRTKYWKNNRNYNISCLKKIPKLTFKTIEINTICKQNNRKSRLLYLINPISYQYIRTKNIWCVHLESAEPIIQIIHQRYIHFLENRLGAAYETCKNMQYIVSKNYTVLLGYHLQFKIHQILIRIQTFSCTFASCLRKKVLLPYNPILFIIRVLAKYRFCNFIGYPISKSGWATLSDSIIINRFKRIRDSLITYYKGSINQKDLLRIKHILHYSCAKTLACKHKTNLRKIWKRYTKNLSIRDPYTHRNIFFDIAINKKKFNSENKQRFWNLYIKEPDPIGILLENTYKVKYYLNS